MQRRYDLDWLRVIAFGLLILFHTGMMFSTWDWHVKNFQTSNAFDHVMRWLHAWRMPLLFFISGSAVWFAMDRLSTWRFFLERQKRLLLPLIFGMLVIIPPQVYCERLYHQEKYDSFWEFYQTLFTLGPYPQGNLSWHHLWYIPYIWTYSMLMLPAFVAIKSRLGRRVLERSFLFLARPWRLFLLFIPSAVVEIALRPRWPGDANNLFDDWGNFAHKLTFFIAGFCLASGTGLYDTIAAHRRKFLVAGALVFPILHLVWNGLFHIPSAAGYRVLANFNIWMWLLTVLGYGRAYLSFNHSLLRAANEAVYPFYILHQTVIIAFAYQLAYLNLAIGLKFLVVVVGTFLVCSLLITFVIKPWNVLRLCFGMKWRRNPQPQRSPSSSPDIAGTPSIAGIPMVIFLAVLSVSLLSGCGRNKGQLVSREIASASLSTNLLHIESRQRLVVYLPPSYAHTDKRFPVLYFLPNFKSVLWRYTGGDFQGFRFEEAMQRQLRSGKVTEMIIVIPNTAHFLGSSWYRNSPLTGDWEDYIVADLVRYMDTNFRTMPEPEGRALAGHGVGGLGALELGLKHPDVFGSVYAMSPTLFDERGIENLGPAVSSTVSEWEKHATIWNALPTAKAQKQFRHFVQTRLNSPDKRVFFEGLYVSYAAAVAPNPSAPYPHISFAITDAGERVQMDSGMGGWKEKLEGYLGRKQLLNSITIEYGRNDEYEFIRLGSEHLSTLMKQMGVQRDLVIHEGGHESTLGSRLENGLLPAVFKSLKAGR